MAFFKAVTAKCVMHNSYKLPWYADLYKKGKILHEAVVISVRDE